MRNTAYFRFKLETFVRHRVTVVQPRAFVGVVEWHRVVVEDVKILQVSVEYNMQRQDHMHDSAEASNDVGQDRVRLHGRLSLTRGDVFRFVNRQTATGCSRSGGRMRPIAERELRHPCARGRESGDATLRHDDCNNSR